MGTSNPFIAAHFREQHWGEGSCKADEKKKKISGQAPETSMLGERTKKTRQEK